MSVERIRKFNTRDVYGPQALDNDVCMVVKAGNRLYLRRYWEHQESLARMLSARASHPIDDVDEVLLEQGLERLFPPTRKGTATDWNGRANDEEEDGGRD